MIISHWIILLAISAEERRRRDRDRKRIVRNTPQGSDKNKKACKKYADKSIDKLKQYRKEKYAKNRSTIDVKNKKWRDENKTSPAYKLYLKRQHYRKEYGLSLEEVENLKNKQDHLCAICKTKPEILVVDHNHDTGEIREMLCRNCNSALGFFKENINTLEAAIKYIQKHN